MANVSTAQRAEIVRLANTEGLTPTQREALASAPLTSVIGDPVAHASRVVTNFLRGNAADARQPWPSALPVAKASAPRSVAAPTALKPAGPTLGELEAKLAKLEAEAHATATAARIVAQQTAERTAQRELIARAFGTSPQRHGCTFDGVVQTFH